jgi:glutamate synthase (NADPH/NADH) small chain
VTVYEAKPKAGGLNEYGLAPYKMTDDFAQKEVEFIVSVGGIKIEHGKKLGKDLMLESLKKSFDAVFLGVGLGSTNSLGIEGENLPGVIDAVKQIDKIRQAKKTSDIDVSSDVVVIGGGNTAVDIAIQMKRLGADNVTLVYRRGREEMGATHHEQELAQTNGVVLKTWAKPSKITGDAKGAQSIELERTALKDGKLVGTGKTYTLKATQIFKAIGQALLNPETPLKTESGKFAVNVDFETSIPGVYAGGDCVGPGEDLTVTAVQHGKLAALAIDKKLKGGSNG